MQHDIPAGPTIGIDDLDEAVRIFLDPPRHHELAGHTLRLPDWFDRAVPAESDAFRAQQMRLWQEITQRTVYDPEADEDTPEIASLDAVRRPAFYATGDSAEAGRHLLAMGHILLRSGVRAGDRVLECGAGFGQNALAFARLGAKVDTVDIAAGFCGAVTQVAARYDVDLTAHRQPFGFNPAGAPGAYDVILFYESFHHCLDFRTVIPMLRDMLKPGGRILMAGEPIVRQPNALMPYPWGIRLDWENVAIMRQRGWMELGFHEDFLVRQFADAGMTWRLFPDANDSKADVYEFRVWNEQISLANCCMTIEQELGWHGAEASGRWSKGRSHFITPAHDGMVEIVLINHHPDPRSVRIALGEQKQDVSLRSLERRNVRFRTRATDGAQVLLVESNVATGGPNDPRQLGIFVETVAVRDFGEIP